MARVAVALVGAWALASCGAGCRGTRAHAGSGDAASAAPADAAVVGSPTASAPRNLWPPSTATVASRMPMFAWRGAEGATRDVLEVCGDRDCTHALVRRETTTARITLDAPLEGLRAFWRVTSILPRGESRTGATWVVRIPPRAAATPSARAFLDGADVNGDGFADLIVSFGPNVLRGGVHFRDRRQDPDVFASPPPDLACSPAPFARAGVDESWGVRFHRPCAELGSAEYVGDVDGDGYGDLLVRAGDSWRLARGSAADVLAIGPSSLRASTGPGGIQAIGDVDGDGFADVAFTGADRALYWGGPDGLIEDRKLLLGGVAVLAAARIDGTSPDHLLGVRGDLPLDLSDPRSQLVDVDVAGRTDVHLGAALSIPPAMGASVTVVAGDFLGTGAACFLLGPFLMGPTTHLGWAGCTSPESLPNAPFRALVADGSLRLRLAATDANGDGIEDVYVSSSGERGEVALLRGGSHPAWAGLRLGCPRDADSCGDVVPLGDVDGDGFGDAFFTWADTMTNDAHLTFLPGSAGKSELDPRLTWVLPRDGQ
jgi:hypothetical protein